MLLDNVTADQRDIIVSLPYRVGLWVGRSDTSGGMRSDAQEAVALSNILHAFAEETFGAETVQRIISQTIRRKAEWPEWSQHLSRVPHDCRIAWDILYEQGDAKDSNAYRNYLMEIAEAVALAFREPVEGFAANLGQYVSFYIETFRSKNARKRKLSLEEYLRISPGERKALRTLADALGTTY